MLVCLSDRTSDRLSHRLSHRLSGRRPGVAGLAALAACSVLAAACGQVSEATPEPQPAADVDPQEPVTPTDPVALAASSTTLPSTFIPLFGRGALQFGTGAVAISAKVATEAVDNLTMEAWFRWDGGTGTQIIAYNGTSRGYGLVLENGEPRVMVSGLGWVICGGACLPTPGTWTHVAAVRSASTWQMYKDGVAMLTLTSGVPYPSVPLGAVTIGALATGASSFNGVIDEVRFWTAPRSATQIRASYPQVLTGAEPDLAAYYRFDEGVGTSVADDSGHANPLTISGAPSWNSSLAGLSLGLSRLALQTTGAATLRASTVALTAIDDFTIESWVRWDGGDGTQAIFYNGDSSTSGYGLYVQDGVVRLLVGGVGWMTCDSCRLVRGLWTYLALVRRQGTWTISQGNGASASSTALTPAAPLGILSVASSPSGAERLVGAVDELRFWNQARTAEQIMADANRAPANNEAGLVHYYRFDDGGGSRAGDMPDGNLPLQVSGTRYWPASGALINMVAR